MLRPCLRCATFAGCTLDLCNDFAPVITCCFLSHSMICYVHLVRIRDCQHMCYSMMIISRYGNALSSPRPCQAGTFNLKIEPTLGQSRTPC